jgi:hypothetical protein
VATAEHHLQHAGAELRRRDPLWAEQLAVLIAILLTFALPDELSVGPRWALPAAEGVLFVALVASTPRPPTRERARRRGLRIALVTLMSAGNAASLVLLARFGVEAHRPSGRSLLLGGVLLWLTAVLLFALWYWEFDRGGPLQRDARPDFVFPQMHDERWAPREWHPMLPDYLYLSFINAATFGPPESTFPITHIAQGVIAVQSFAALTTDALIVARAVNLLQ